MDPKRFETALLSLFDKDEDKVTQACHYALSASGKRLRPQLLFALLKDLRIAEETGLSCALAIELVHNYSLVHDDLPEMDDDDWRHGRPTIHKAYDQATAVLAGDALLTKAFEVIAQDKGLSEGMRVSCISALAKAAGHKGMILGQVLDLNIELESADGSTLKKMDEAKTGELLALPLSCGLILANKTEQIESAQTLGKALGVAFQIQDDIFDVTKSLKELGKEASDEKNQKVNYVSIYGLEKAKALADELFQTCLDSCKDKGWMKTGELISHISLRDY